MMDHFEDYSGLGVDSLPGRAVSSLSYSPNLPLRTPALAAAGLSSITNSILVANSTIGTPSLFTQRRSPRFIQTQAQRSNAFIPHSLQQPTSTLAFNPQSVPTIATTPFVPATTAAIAAAAPQSSILGYMPSPLSQLRRTKKERNDAMTTEEKNPNTNTSMLSAEPLSIPATSASSSSAASSVLSSAASSVDNMQDGAAASSSSSSSSSSTNSSLKSEFSHSSKRKRKSHNESPKSSKALDNESGNESKEKLARKTLKGDHRTSMDGDVLNAQLETLKTMRRQSTSGTSGGPHSTDKPTPPQPPGVLMSTSTAGQPPTSSSSFSSSSAPASSSASSSLGSHLHSAANFSSQMAPNMGAVDYPVYSTSSTQLHHHLHPMHLPVSATNAPSSNSNSNLYGSHDGNLSLMQANPNGASTQSSGGLAASTLALTNQLQSVINQLQAKGLDPITLINPAMNSLQHNHPNQNFSTGPVGSAQQSGGVTRFSPSTAYRPPLVSQDGLSSVPAFDPLLAQIYSQAAQQAQQQPSGGMSSYSFGNPNLPLPSAHFASHLNLSFPPGAAAAAAAAAANYPSQYASNPGAYLAQFTNSARATVDPNALLPFNGNPLLRGVSSMDGFGVSGGAVSVTQEFSDGSIEVVDADGKKKRVPGSSCHQCKTRRVSNELYYCFTPVHQLLTCRGFVFVDDIKNGDLVASYSKDKKNFKFVPCKTIRKEGTHTIYTFKSHVSTIEACGSTGKTSHEKSENIEVTVTDDHDLWMQKRRVSRKHGEWCKVKARDLYDYFRDDKMASGESSSNGAEAKIARVLTGVPNGVVNSINVMDLEFVKKLNLKEDQVDTFLQLYGYWIGDGRLRFHKDCSISSWSVQFSPAKEDDKDWLIKHFTTLNLKQGTGYIQCKDITATRQTLLCVTDKRWVEYFMSEYGKKYQHHPEYCAPSPVRSDSSNSSSSGPQALPADFFVPGVVSVPDSAAPNSAKWYWYWYRHLGSHHCRQIIKGLGFAGADVNEGTTAAIFASSILFRDETIDLAIRAGYVVDFSMMQQAGTDGETSICGSQIAAAVANWTIELDDKHERVLKGGDEEKSSYSGPVHCVSVGGDGLIIARKVFNWETIKDRNGQLYKNVTQASKPLVIGNCSMRHLKRGRSRRRKKEKICRKKYCGRCLVKFYNEQPPPLAGPHPNNLWSCPGCRYLCTCAACKRSKVKREAKLLKQQQKEQAAQAAKAAKAALKQKTAQAAAAAASSIDSQNSESTSEPNSSSTITDNATLDSSSSASSSNNSTTPSLSSTSSASSSAGFSNLNALAASPPASSASFASTSALVSSSASSVTLLLPSSSSSTLSSSSSVSSLASSSSSAHLQTPPSQHSSPPFGMSGLPAMGTPFIHAHAFDESGMKRRTPKTGIRRMEEIAPPPQAIPAWPAPTPALASQSLMPPFVPASMQQYSPYSATSTLSSASPLMHYSSMTPAVAFSSLTPHLPAGSALLTTPHPTMRLGRSPRQQHRQQNEDESVQWTTTFQNPDLL